VTSDLIRKLNRKMQSNSKASY